jgi:hypothetical protein
MDRVGRSAPATMFGENLAAFFRLYAQPVSALSQILDRGRLWFAALAAVGVSFLLHSTDVVPQFFVERPGFVTAAILRFVSYETGRYFAALGAVAILLGPAIILGRAVGGYGSFGVLMRSDYVPLLVCLWMCWGAAYLPLAAARFFIDSPLLFDPPVYFVVSFYFLVLAALSARTIYGTGFGPAIGLASLGWIAGVFGMGLFAVVGPLLYFLGSPLVLLYLYFLFGSNLRSLGDGLRQRQHFQQQLEIATTNPHDADAQYQLGLIHQKRRQYTEAIARFERSVEIDPEHADAHLQLGRIAREQGRFEDAIRHLKQAAAIDDKLALSDVWRDLGAAALSANQLEEARAALAKFTSRRPYDPEGLYWYGKTLLALGQRNEAREMFERCIEAANSMPAHLRPYGRSWRKQSEAELRTLRA